MWRLYCTNPPPNRDRAATNSFENSLANKVAKTITGLIVSKLHGWRHIRVIRNTFKIPLERFKKFREGNFMLYPIQNLIGSVIRAKGGDLLPDLRKLMKLTSDEHVWITKTQFCNIGKKFSSTYILNENVVKTGSCHSSIKWPHIHGYPTGDPCVRNLDARHRITGTWGTRRKYPTLLLQKKT